jgi:alpha-N-arabinofuranosidase
MTALNTFESPNAVKPAPFSGYTIRDGRVALSIPAKSVVVLVLQ